MNPLKINDLISILVITPLFLSDLTSGETTFLGGNLLNTANWSNGLPAGQHATITEDGSYVGLNQNVGWINGSTVSIGGNATLELSNDLSVFGASVNMYSGTINCADDFFAQNGTITIYDGTTSANDQFTSNANQGKIIIYGGSHSSGLASNDYFGASGSVSDQGQSMNILGGTITAGGYRFQEFTENSLGGEAVLLSASGSTGLEMSGSMKIASDWIGSWTVRSFSGNDWQNELTSGGWTLNSETIDSVSFAENFEVSANGETLNLKITSFLGNQLTSASNWSNGLAPTNQNLAIKQNGINTTINQDNPWISGSTVTMGGEAVLTMKDIAVKDASFTMYSGAINCSDDFFAVDGTITIYGGTTKSLDEYAANSRQGRIIIYGGNHSSGVGSGEYFGATASVGDQGQGMDILGGTVTGGTYRFQKFTVNSIGGEAVLLSASSSTGLEMSGMMNIVGGWIGSWTVESFSGNDWKNELVSGGWLLNGLPINDTNFASGFRVSGNGKTLSATGLFSEINLFEAIEALKNHINGSSLVSDELLISYKVAIDRNIEDLAFDENMIRACLELVETYDTHVGPLWVLGSPVRKFSRADATNSDVHWIIYTVMQGLMDYSYTSDNIARYTTLLDGYKFGSSEHFPGAVTPPTNQNATYTVKINGSYLDTFGKNINHDDRPGRKPTGAYLAPGSIATVIVPAALVNKGYQVRVGAYSWDLAIQPEVRRLDRSSLVYDIDATSLKVANPLGGGIYIEVPYLADEGIIDISIQNTVRSPYFSSKSFHQTTLAEWRNVERHHPGPTADFQTDKFMLQIPSKSIFALDDPLTALKKWDETIDAMNDLLGYPHIRGKETLYAQVDVNPRSTSFAPGYPMSNFNYDPDAFSDGNSQSLFFRGPEVADWIFYHEHGHQYQMPKFAGEEESTVNILGMAVRTRLFGWSLDEAFRLSATTTNLTINHSVAGASVVNMLSEKFVNAVHATDGTSLTGHTKYVDIVRLFGWEVLEKHWFSINLEHENGNPLGVYLNRDDLILKMSEATGYDMRPLFHFWNIHPANAADLESRLAASELQPSAVIYNELVSRKSMIPANNAAFRAFSTHWWDGVPTSDSAFRGKRYDASIWNSYDESVAAVIATNLQNIIDLYFPDGEPIGNAKAHWSLNDGNGTVVSDSSGNNFHGTTNNTSWVDGVDGTALEFNGTNSNVTLPAAAFASIDQEITIAMWVLGSATQPRKDSIFYATNSTGARLLNIHLPWSNSNVYWDAGDSSGYDRINKVASSSEFKGQWNHWAFTKNSTLGVMSIYLNGQLWHSEAGNTAPLSGITNVRLGSQTSGNVYDGMIDEVTLYNSALSPANIRELYSRPKPYLGWLGNHPNLVDLAFTGDPDNDGIDTGLEYVLNGNPTLDDNVTLPVLKLEGENFVFNFTRLASSTVDTIQVIQYSSTLQSNDWKELNLTGSTTNDVTIRDTVNGLQEVSGSISKDEAIGGKMFGRLLVSPVE